MSKKIEAKFDRSAKCTSCGKTGAWDCCGWCKKCETRNYEQAKADEALRKVVAGVKKFLAGRGPKEAAEAARRHYASLIPPQLLPNAPLGNLPTGVGK